MRSVSLHFSPTKLFSPQCRPRSCSRGACCVCCGCQDGTGSTAQPRLSTPLAPAHSQYSSPPTGQLSLCTPPTCPSSKAEPHCCQIHPNPSRLIAVEWDPENSLLTTEGTSGHSSGQILTSRQSNAFAATIHQRCEEGERCKGEEPSYTDQPTPVKLHADPL